MPPPERRSDSIRSARESCHIIEAIPNVELERRIADALRGEASVAPLDADRRVRAANVSRLGLSADGRERGARSASSIFSDDQTGLVRLDRARKEFLSNVSHELRTPLSSIKLMLETVLEAPEEEARDLFVPQALAQVDRLTALVGQLLEQARAESGQLKLDLRDVDLEEVARPIVASFEQQASNKGISLELLAAAPGARRGRSRPPRRKSSSTLSTTRCATRPAADAYESSSTRAIAMRSCACATPAKEFRIATFRISSSASTSSIARARAAAAAPASAWPSSRASSTRTAERSRPNRCSAAARRSRFGCRSCASSVENRPRERIA